MGRLHLRYLLLRADIPQTPTSNDPRGAYTVPFSLPEYRMLSPRKWMRRKLDRVFMTLRNVSSMEFVRVSIR